MKDIFVLKTVGTTLILLSLLTSPTFMVVAGSDTNNQKPILQHQHGKPPQPAIDICLSKEENSACEFQGPQETEKGICEFTPDQRYFACKPSRQGRQPRPSTDNHRVKQMPSHLADKVN
ncbi:hypothetical protein [Colwellia psychrerythraea]|uniref:Uncharacterized protein n=1 Tax=Colwellia psychrerythraea TaxID=28229 RepID=A0A099KVU1_COLPS|nr:hypothetical protein [Colwellia psychrerythraea]KGJ93977.1 hypothetical protein GAB14E_2532 [Colwellia psychrerythraea]